MQTALCAHRPS